ncbi:MAG: universal stress protein, partial [Deltaproteobacteria bacterium]|nr:universal stress protein [Deltaproteobacteria bacterium]
PHSLNAVAYAAQYCGPADLKMNLMHVIPPAPETLLDLGKEYFFKDLMEEHRIEWNKKAEKVAKVFLDKALNLLVAGGVPKNNVAVILQERKVGIARDIIEESLRGYNAVVVGRGGLSRPEEPFLGSVSNKIVEKIQDVPVWVVGRDIRTRKMLLAVDASENSRKAVNYVGEVAAASEAEITLFHVVRKFGYLNDPTLREGEIEGFWEEVKSDIPRMFRSYQVSLEKAGITPLRISSEAMLDSPSRSGDIIREAREGAYGTIVMGRRGLSKVRDFLMGRVTSKVLNQAEDFAVWIVP